MRLPPKDAKQFFRIMMPLLNWVKTKDTALSELKRESGGEYPAAKEAHIILQVLWQRPELIGEYVAEKGANLTAPVKEVLSAWKKNYVKGPFIIERFLPTGAVFISIADGQAYLVSGITSNIEDSLSKRDLPCLAETTLLPYRGRIIYDSTLGTRPYTISSATLPARSLYAIWNL